MAVHTVGSACFSSSSWTIPKWLELLAAMSGVMPWCARVPIIGGGEVVERGVG